MRRWCLPTRVAVPPGTRPGPGGGRPGPWLACLPRGMARRITLRSVARLVRTIFEGELNSHPPVVEFKMAAPLSIVALPGGEACLFYGSAYLELLRGLTGFEGALLHESCRSRGDGACLWRTATAEVYE